MPENDIQINQAREYNLRLGDNPSKIDEVSPSLMYIGFALTLAADPSMPIWKIKKIEQTGSVWEIKYANGNELYENIWNNRSILNYK